MTAPPLAYQSDSLQPLASSLAPVARRWRWIASGSVLGLICGAALAALFPSFEATGFYYTSGWTLADYKRFRSEFGSADSLASYISESRPDDGESAEVLLRESRRPTFWASAVRPLYPLTRKDAKEVFETSKDKEGVSILGLDLSVRAASAGVARDGVILIGNYLSQTLLLSGLQNWVAAGQSSTNGELLKAENQLLQTRYSIEQTRQRIEELLALRTKYPESQRMEMRQVVSADAASARFLAPISQVVALEAAVAESNEALRRLERRVRQLQLEAAYFNAAAGKIRSTVLGRKLLDQLVEERRTVFAQVPPSDDALKEVSNRFDLELKSFRDQFSIGFGFRTPVLEPSRSDRPASRWALLGAVLGGMFGLLPAVLLAFWQPGARPERDRNPHIQPVGAE